MMASQSEPNGEFPSVPYPNPESPDAMQIGIDYAKAHDLDVFIATDPDADRIGAAYKNSEGGYTLLNGNQIGVLIELYLFKKNLNNAFIVSTIVTTPLIGVLAKAHEVSYSEVLTGFKWIALETQKQLDSGKNFLFGMEESHGYNISDKIRDKDGVTATAIFSELTAYYKSQGKCLDQVLLETSIAHGYYKDSQYSVTIPGKEGVEKINKLMDSLRKNPPKSLSEFKLEKAVDYLKSSTGLPPSNVIALHYEQNIRVIARPSGTEPKIKFYFSTSGDVACMHCVAEVEERHEFLVKKFLESINI